MSGNNSYTHYQAKFMEGISGNFATDTTSKFIIRGELSGIQDYIFNIPSKGAAQYLKGRSAYLQLLPEAIARYVHAKINIPGKKDYGDSLVFSGGGNFMLIYQTDNDLTAATDQYHNFIEDVLLKYHNGRIYLALAGANMSDPGYETTLAKRLYFRKKNKFIDNTGAFMPFELLEKKPKPKQDYQSFYKSFQILTRQFSGHLAQEIDTVPEGWQRVLEEFNTSYQDLRASVNIIGNDVTNFDHLAEFSEGAKKLAILKLDVDDLGQLFAGKPSAATADISRALTYFFSDHLDHLFKKEEYTSREEKSLKNDDNTFDLYKKGTRLVYTVYSGGDDCFLIGPWHIMIELAGEISGAFTEFTKNNGSLSASLTLIDESFPIIRGAVLASEQLEMAKGKQEKNGVCIFNQVFGWEEWKYLLEIKKLLTEIIQQTPGNVKSIIRKVESTTASFAKIIEGARKDELKMQSIYRLMYYLRNFKAGKQQLADIYQSIIAEQFLSVEFFNNKNSSLKSVRGINYMIIPISCRLTELCFRAAK